MTGRNPIESLQGEARYYRDRVALLDAKRHRVDIGSSARLNELERGLETAERGLREARLREQR